MENKIIQRNKTNFFQCFVKEPFKWKLKMRKTQNSVQFSFCEKNSYIYIHTYTYLENISLPKKLKCDFFWTLNEHFFYAHLSFVRQFEFDLFPLVPPPPLNPSYILNVRPFFNDTQTYTHLYKNFIIIIFSRWITEPKISDHTNVEKKIM